MIEVELMELIDVPPAPSWPRYYALGEYLVALPTSGQNGQSYVIVRLCRDGTREILLQSDRWELVWRSLVSLALCVTRHRREKVAWLN